MAVPPTTAWKYAPVPGCYPVDFQPIEDIPRAPSRDAIDLIPDRWSWGVSGSSVSASQGPRFAQVATERVEQLRKLLRIRIERSN